MPEVQHVFMAEWIPYKQKHLMELELSEECCLFADACKVFSDDRECVRHGGACVSCLTSTSQFDFLSWNVLLSLLFGLEARLRIFQSRCGDLMVDSPASPSVAYIQILLPFRER